MAPRRRRSLIADDDELAISADVLEAHRLEDEGLRLAEELAMARERRGFSSAELAEDSEQSASDDGEGARTERGPPAMRAPSAPAGRLTQTGLFGRPVAGARPAGASRSRSEEPPGSVASSESSARSNRTDDLFESELDADGLPELAQHERERKAKMKKPVGQRGRSKVQRVTKETGVSFVICRYIANDALFSDFKPTFVRKK